MVKLGDNGGNLWKSVIASMTRKAQALILESDIEPAFGS